jgi:hypothetical protein
MGELLGVVDVVAGDRLPAEASRKIARKKSESELSLTKRFTPSAPRDPDGPLRRG